MITLKAVYRVVTPLFAGGAGSEQAAELRAPAFKGALRFWYRAMALPFHKTWENVRKAEQELFGSTGGQAAFLLKVQSKEEPEVVLPGYKWQGPGSTYLGYGLIRPGKVGTTTRAYLKQGFCFIAILTLRPKRVKEADLAGLKRALIALGLFGGLGARSRRGFGSLALESLQEDDREIWAAPRDAGELRDKMKDLLQEVSLQDELPEYSAFSRHSRVSMVTSKSDALSLLDYVGREMIRYRSFGRESKGKRVLPWGEKAEQNFAGDHDLVWSVARGREPDSHPRRVVFGLPHNYFFFSANKRVEVNAKESQRRASPLFIHIHQLAGGCTAVFTVLPARFLPCGDRIEMKAKGAASVEVAPRVKYEDIYRFLNRFPDRLEVLP